MAYNKINYNGNTLIDLTGDDVATADVLSGKNFHTRDGESAQGSMNNRGAVSGTIATKAGTYTVPQGYHNGNGTVGISSTEQQKIIAENIKKGVTILGQAGSYEGEAPTLQTVSKSYTPSASAQSETITPGTGYDYIEEVDISIAAIPYEEVPNTYGTTVNIG